MNMKSRPGQMWRWLGDILNFELGVDRGVASSGWIWNSHQSVSMYSCW